MGKRKRAPKPCDRCHQIASIRYRIQCDETAQWKIVCSSCWQGLSQDNPFYRYGGTWKAR